MQYQIFLTNLKEHLEVHLGEGYTVQIHTITKNNDTTYDSIIIFDQESSISPTIYIQEFYDSYCHGKTLDDISAEISKLYFDSIAQTKQLNFSDNLEFSHYKNRIIFRLTNFEKNRNILQSQPYIRFLDLAITFYCLISKDKNGIRSMRITNDIMQYWDVNTQQLFKLASQNTPKLFPFKLCTMHDIMINMLKSEGISLDDIEDSPDMDSPDKHMYVLTNQLGINGATAILYKDIIKHLLKELHSDFYILPSSIHELILVPYTNQLNKEELLHMVSDVNHTLVASEDILSDQVYLYRSKLNSFEM